MINLFLFVSENNVFGFYECFQFNTSNLWCLRLQVQRSSGFTFNHKNRSCGCFSELFTSLATTSENAFLNIQRKWSYGIKYKYERQDDAWFIRYSHRNEFNLVFLSNPWNILCLKSMVGDTRNFLVRHCQKLGMWISIIVFHSELRSNRKWSTCIGLDSH